MTGKELAAMIESALQKEDLPRTARVVTQGVAGAFQHSACEELFDHPQITFRSSFEAVFEAIERNECTYGVIPIENSTAGSVNAVYDLMREHSFYIVRSVKLRIEHNLLVRPGVRLEDIEEIYSHEQALSQCSEFLGKLEGVKVIACANTAIAARMVSESDRPIAALASRQCIDLYGLQCLQYSVQNVNNNFTRFVCISKQPQIFPGATRTSLMMILKNEPGTLYKVLGKFAALGINLNKLESRPLPERQFEFMFYFDIESSAINGDMLTLMEQLPDCCEMFRYLGSYSEIDTCALPDREKEN